MTKNRIKEWLNKTDPEGLTNLDAICMVSHIIIGLSIAFGLIIWASKYCNC